MSHRFPAFLRLSLLLATALPVSAEPVIWTIQPSGKGPEVSPVMHGIFFEDINYAGDGGLYAELVQNRSFEHRDSLVAWKEETRGDADGGITISEENPVHPNNPRFIRIFPDKPGDGVGLSSEGYGGIPLKKGGVYRFSTHARGPEGYAGGLNVRLEDGNGELLAEGRIESLAKDWKRESLELTSSKTTTDGRLVLLADTTGVVDLDMISLFPKDTWKGRENGMRPDLARMLADMKPGFMRFPGGCIVEGNDLPNAYRWKDTVGPIWERKQNWNRWIQDDPNRPDHHYHQTYGLGFFEFFQLCEDLGATAVPVLNCGMSCQFQAKQLVPMNDLDEWVQDAIDLIEFANGPATSKWGKLRADMGHPEPFGMKYLGIGNEQWGPEYFKRYDVFHKALKASNPEIVLITTSGPGVDDGNWQLAWDKFRGGTPAEIVDEHYYRPPAWFLDHANRYDSYDRDGPKVFAGEFAAHRADRLSSIEPAVCEAAFMTGLLRNADVVRMTCYAPLFARDGYVQWTPDLIWFDATRVMPTPSYHIQAMYGTNRPDRIVPSDFEGNEVVTGSGGRVGVGTWQTQAEFRDLVVSKGGEVVFRSRKGLDGFLPSGGEWEGERGVIRQKGGEMPATAMVETPAGNDCTIEVKARKTGGNEGFLILFRSDGGTERCWWNIGGWGNTAHALEINGWESPQVNGTIETNRWYDVRIELNGPRVRCFLDDKLIHDVTRHGRPRIHAVAGLDFTAKELVLHVSNPSSEACATEIRIQGWPGRKPAYGSFLASGSADDHNTFDHPDKVAPRDIKLPVRNGVVRHTLPAWSHTVLRVPR